MTGPGPDMGEDDTLVQGVPGEGEVIGGKYRIYRTLGAGGMGLVVSARHIHLGQQVAMKFLLPGPGDQREPVARFVREARTIATLQSEHVVRVVDVDTLSNGAPYIVMEHLVGTDLSKVIAEEGPLPVPTAVEYVLQACEAIAEAHTSGIVHRDLKPANLFLTRRASGAPLVKVLDFGIAKRAEGDDGDGAKLTTTGAAMGSPQYMSPEQIRSARDVDGRTDIWAIGVMLHELVTGRAPFEATAAPSLLAKILTEPPTPLRAHLEGAPPELEALILRCLEKDPAKRPADIAELASLLLPFAGEGRVALPPRILPVQAPPTAVTAVVTPPRRSRGPQLAVAGVAMGLAVAVLTAATVRSLRSPAGPALAVSSRAIDGTPAPAPVTAATSAVIVEPARAPPVETAAVALPSAVSSEPRRPEAPARPRPSRAAAVSPPPPAEPRYVPRPPSVDPMGDRQ